MDENLESIIHDDEQAATAKQAAYQRQYRTQFLGYKKQRGADFKKVDQDMRIAIIFDHAVHRKIVKRIIRDHGINYSTLRHILIQYYLFGRTDVRKFRPGPPVQLPQKS